MCEGRLTSDAAGSLAGTIKLPEVIPLNYQGVGSLYIADGQTHVGGRTMTFEKIKLTAPGIGSMGEEIEVSSANLASGRSYRLIWGRYGRGQQPCLGQLTADAEGRIKGKVRLPKTIAQADQNVGDLNLEPTVSRTVIAGRPMEIRKVKVVAPSRGYMGQKITVSADNLAPGATYQLLCGRRDGSRQRCAGELTADLGGRIEGKVRLPIAISQADQRLGDLDLVPKGSSTILAGRPLEIVKVKLEAPGRSHMGQQITVSADYLAPGGKYEFRWWVSTNREWACEGTLDADAAGRITGKIRLPPAVPAGHQKLGSLYVCPAGARTRVGGRPLELEKVVVELSGDLRLDQQVRISATNLAPEQPYVFGWWKRANQEWACQGELTSDAGGRISGQIRMPLAVPAGAQGLGSFYVYPKYNRVPVGGRPVYIAKAVLNAPSSSAVGRRIPLVLRNLASAASYKLEWRRGSHRISLADEVVTDANGGFTGPYRLRAEQPSTVTGEVLLYLVDVRSPSALVAEGDTSDKEPQYETLSIGATTFWYVAEEIKKYVKDVNDGGTGHGSEL